MSTRRLNELRRLANEEKRSGDREVGKQDEIVPWAVLSLHRIGTQLVALN
jgi:hypothetical protein